MNWEKVIVIISFCFACLRTSLAQAPVKLVRVYGSSYNAGTGADLPVKVLQLQNKRRTKLGDSNEKGRFDFKVPVTTTALVFEAKGFNSITIPVHFIGVIDPEYVFNMAVPMTAKDTPVPKPGNQLYLAFNRTDTTTVTYEVQYGSDLSFVTRVTSKQFKGASSFVLRDARPGEYLISACTSDGYLLFQERFKMEPGVNFKALGVKGVSYRKAPIPEETVPPSTDIQTIYFDQSSYDLRADSKAQLDPIASQLLKHHDWKIRITGFTDNVGPRQPNMVLSEFRAKVVAGYFRQKGVADEQMTIDWKGPEKAVAPNDEEANKEKNRRVEVILVAK